MPFRKRNIIFISFLVLLLLAVASVLFLNNFLQNPSIRRYVLGEISSAIGHEVHTSKIQVNLWSGLGIGADDFEVRPGSGLQKITASKIAVSLDARKLIRGKVVPTRVFLLRPRVELVMEDGGHISKDVKGLDFGELLGKTLAGFQSVRLEDGQISIRGFPIIFEELNADIWRKSGGPPKLGLRLRAKAGFRNENVPFIVRGTIAQEVTAEDNTLADITLKTEDVPLSWIPWPVCLPVSNGHARALVKFKMKLNGSISAEGKITAKDLSFRIDQEERTKGYLLPHLSLDFQSLYSKRVLQLSSLLLKADDLSLKADSELDFRCNPDFHLALRLYGPPMPLDTFKKIFPTPLLPQWLETRLFPIFRGGKVRTDLFSLNGSLDQIKSLNLPENAGILSLRLTFINMGMLEEGSFLPLSDVSGELSIEKGSLLISGARADFVDSVINDFSLKIPCLYAKDLSYFVSADGTFELNDLKQQSLLDLTPVNLRNWCQGLESVSGKVHARIHAEYRDRWNYPIMQKGEFRFEGCSIVHNKLSLPLYPDKARLWAEEEKKQGFQGTGLWGKSWFRVSGSAGTSWESLDLKVVARADMNEVMARFCQVYQKKMDQFPVKFHKHIDCRFSLIREDGFWSSQGEVDPEGITIDTSSIAADLPGAENSIHFKVDLSPGERINLRYFLCSLGESSFSLSGSYDLKDEEPLRLNVSTGSLALEDLGVRIKETNSPVKGTIRCGVEVSTSVRNPEETWVTGEVEAVDISFFSNAMPSPLRDGEIALRFSGKEVSLETLGFRVGHSDVRIRGRLEGWDRVSGRLTLDSEYLDLSDFWKKKPCLLPKEMSSGLSSFITRCDLRLKLKVSKGRWKNMVYGPVEAECAFRSGHFHVERARAKVGDGLLLVKGNVKTGKTPELAFASYIKLTGDPLKAVLKNLDLEKYLDLTDVLLTTDKPVFMKGRNKEELISSLTGSINILLEKGKIMKSNVIYKILEFLSLKNVITRKPPDLSKEGFYFDSIEGHATLNAGILEATDVVMKSPVFNSVGKGTIDLNKKEVDLDLGVAPLGTLDSLVSKIPIVGYILTGKKKTLLTFYFKVTGTLGKPKVRYVPFNSLPKSLLGYFKRLFLTPGHLYERMLGIKEYFTIKPPPRPAGELEFKMPQGPRQE